MYGTGMRLMECLRLRIKDVDFALNQILIRDGKEVKVQTWAFRDRTLKGMVCIGHAPAHRGRAGAMLCNEARGKTIRVAIKDIGDISLLPKFDPA